MSKAQQFRESILRALNHHELAGRLSFVSDPGDGYSKWRIRLPGEITTLELTTSEAWALCQGLAAWERGKLHQPG